MSMHANKYKTFNIYENTSKELFEQLNNEFDFNFDPCPENPQFNGLEVDWTGNVYVNPPYGKQIKYWLLKCLQEIEKCNLKTCVFLLPSYTDVKWFHEIVIPNAHEIRFIKGRLKFGNHKESAPFASMLIIFKSIL